MKKLSIILAIMTLLMFFSGCAANAKGNNSDGDTSQDKQAKAILTGKVIKIYEKNMLVSSIEDDVKSSDIYIVPIDAEFDAEKIKAGSIVKIGHDGLVRESYPAQLGNVEYIKFLEQKDDFVGLYEKVFDKLWEIDSGLNSDINILAFDLSKTTNLSDAEKSALIYILGNKQGLETVAGTFEQLRNDGYIEKDILLFKNGLLFDFEVTKQSKNSFTFNAKKWRSGDGAYYFNDCKAKKTGDTWDFTVGSEAIS